MGGTCIKNTVTPSYDCPKKSLVVRDIDDVEHEETFIHKGSSKLFESKTYQRLVDEEKPLDSALSSGQSQMYWTSDIANSEKTTIDLSTVTQFTADSGAYCSEKLSQTGVNKFYWTMSGRQSTGKSVSVQYRQTVQIATTGESTRSESHVSDMSEETLPGELFNGKRSNSHSDGIISATLLDSATNNEKTTLMNQNETAGFLSVASQQFISATPQLHNDSLIDSEDFYEISDSIISSSLSYDERESTGMENNNQSVLIRDSTAEHQLENAMFNDEESPTYNASLC